MEIALCGMQGRLQFSDSDRRVVSDERNGAAPGRAFPGRSEPKASDAYETGRGDAATGETRNRTQFPIERG